MIRKYQSKLYLWKQIVTIKKIEYEFNYRIPIKKHDR